MAISTNGRQVEALVEGKTGYQIVKMSHLC